MVGGWYSPATTVLPMTMAGHSQALSTNQITHIDIVISAQNFFFCRENSSGKSGKNPTGGPRPTLPPPSSKPSWLPPKQEVPTPAVGFCYLFVWGYIADLTMVPRLRRGRLAGRALSLRCEMKKIRGFSSRPHFRPSCPTLSAPTRRSGWPTSRATSACSSSSGSSRRRRRPGRLASRSSPAPSASRRRRGRGVRPVG